MHTSSNPKTDLNVYSDVYMLELVEQSHKAWVVVFLFSKIDRMPFLSTSELDYETKTCCQTPRESEISAEASVVTTA